MTSRQKSVGFSRFCGSGGAGFRPDSFTVLTSPHRDAQQFDAAQPFEVVRAREPVLLPPPPMVKRVTRS